MTDVLPLDWPEEKVMDDPYVLLQSCNHARAADCVNPSKCDRRLRLLKFSFHHPRAPTLFFSLNLAGGLGCLVGWRPMQRCSLASRRVPLSLVEACASSSRP